jgi:hypothetical protein
MVFTLIYEQELLLEPHPEIIEPPPQKKANSPPKNMEECRVTVLKKIIIKQDFISA